MKGRAGVNLSCGDEEEEVSLSEVRLIEFMLPFSITRRVQKWLLTFGTLNLSGVIREVLLILKMTLHLLLFLGRPLFAADATEITNQTHMYGTRI